MISYPYKTCLCTFWHYHPHFILWLPCAHAQGVKQLICPSVVVGTKIARSRLLDIYVGCSLSTTNWQISVKNWLLHASNGWKWFTSATNRAFSVQHACGLATTPTLLACTDATAHARAQCRKGRQVIIIALYSSVATERAGYSLARKLLLLKKRERVW